MIPPQLNNLTAAQPETLRAANDTNIHRPLALNLGLNRSYGWISIVTDVPYPTIGADFLQNFDLLITARQKKIADR